VVNSQLQGRERKRKRVFGIEWSNNERRKEIRRLEQ
jgi:hypothetical protein